MAEMSLKNTIIQLLEKQHLLSVSEVLQALKKEGKTYNKTSVYRALDQLLAEEVVCRHHFSESEASYELREHHHAHLVCESCGSVEAGPCQYTQPKRLKNFSVSHHHLTLFGTCMKCQKQKRLTTKK